LTRQARSVTDDWTIPARKRLPFPKAELIGKIRVEVKFR
jgi:hypothetical protein